MEEGTLVEWVKRDGERVAVGDALFVLESDKAAEVVEAIDAGVLRLTADSPGPGDKVRVGQVLGYLAAEGEQVETAPVDPIPSAPTLPPSSRFGEGGAEKRGESARNEEG